jgi:hypothetical protein
MAIVRHRLSLRKCCILIVLAALFTTSVQAETSLEYVPRCDVLHSDIKREMYLRLAADNSEKLSDNLINLTSFRTRLEGFLTREESDLNEAWIDFAFKNGIGLRFGRQPIRWSQSWTLPSLDLLTGRRFHRFFIDPLIDQLTHPDAVRLTATGNLTETMWDIDLVQVFGSAPFRFAAPLANRDRENLGETAIKLGTKLGILEMAVISSTKKISGTSKRENRSGLLASYAFEKTVLKLEVGTSDQNASFATIGTDWFLDDWMVGPQFTTFRDPANRTESEALFYLPVRYNHAKWLMELDLLVGFGPKKSGPTNPNDDRFLSFRVGYEIYEGLVASALAQQYKGESGRLLGQAQSFLGETIFGIRIEYTGGFVL